MKLKNTAIAAVIIPVLFLTACVEILPDLQTEAPQYTAESTHNANALPPADTDNYGKQASQIVDGAITDALAILNTDSNISSDAPASTPRREKLTEPVRKIYDMIFSAVEKIEDYEWDSSGYGDAFSDFMAADEALRADHPRLRAYYYPDVSGNVFKPIYFLPGTSYDSPTGDKEAIARSMGIFDAVSKRIIDCMPRGLSDSGKYRYFAAVITERCEYDRSLSSAGLPYPAYNALVNGTAVCSGYASALEHLCKEVGLFCQRVDGRKDGGEHAWNRICLGGSFYYCDLTAADAEIPGSDAWLKCTVITAERAKIENYRPFGAGMTVDGTAVSCSRMSGLQYYIDCKSAIFSRTRQQQAAALRS